MKGWSLQLRMHQGILLQESCSISVFTPAFQYTFFIHLLISQDSKGWAAYLREIRTKRIPSNLVLTSAVVSRLYLFFKGYMPVVTGHLVCPIPPSLQLCLS